MSTSREAAEARCVTSGSDFPFASAAGYAGRLVLSGPAAGVVAARAMGSAKGQASVISFDMGGTSTDVCRIDGQAGGGGGHGSAGWVNRVPSLPVRTIGAGGGSLAWVDEGGALRVGPRSAGAHPGPAAYGLGGSQATVTDANVVLGRINADRPIGGKLARLDVEAAARAIETHIARPLGLDALAAAEAIVTVANSRMAGAIRLVSIERGFDPKHFAYMPFGGGGALHACALIREVGLGRAIVPCYPGVTSAMGCVIADMRQDFVQTINQATQAVDEAALGRLMQSHMEEGMRVLRSAGVAFAGEEVSFELDMAYLGQTHTVAVPLPVEVSAQRVAPPSRAEIAAAFDAAYLRVYGRLLPGGVTRVLNLRSTLIGKRPKFDLTTLAPGADASREAARRPGRARAPDAAPQRPGVGRSGQHPAERPCPPRPQCPPRGPCLLERPGHHRR